MQQEVKWAMNHDAVFLHHPGEFPTTPMPSKKRKTANRPKTGKKLDYRQLAETKGSEAITVAWTVSITTLLGCNLAILAIHYWLGSTPEARGLAILKELLLFSAATIGGLSLLLLPVVYRLRTIPPPTGLAVFGVCLAVAPISILLLRAVQ